MSLAMNLLVDLIPQIFLTSQFLSKKEDMANLSYTQNPELKKSFRHQKKKKKIQPNMENSYFNAFNKLKNVESKKGQIILLSKVDKNEK
jgi:hypothetical protein